MEWEVVVNFNGRALTEHTELPYMIKSLSSPFTLPKTQDMRREQNAMVLRLRPLPGLPGVPPAERQAGLECLAKEAGHPS